ncbi:MAG: pantoate--beta-alanine ligase [Acidimicrobiales bacterium]
MRVVDRVESVRKELDGAASVAVGFVPTMGALHEGHASLIRRSAAENDLTLVSVFVNPLQFGPSEDFARYPRDVAADVEVAEAAGADLLFAPAVEEMYPEPPMVTVTVGALGDVLEGATRPGHFAGMATVVAKLFAMTGPGRAYFGEKDYQQLLIVRRLAADLSFPVEVVGCPTVREPDGLARSSRNAYLPAAERRAATVLYRALEAAAATSSDDGNELRSVMTKTIAAEPLVRLDYAAVADPATLAPLLRISGAARLLVAAWVGSTRLIDNRDVTR